jgi:hypothetical protein
MKSGAQAFLKGLGESLDLTSIKLQGDGHEHISDNLNIT